MRRNLTSNVRELLRTFARPFDSYRPELHYMRGPGPKWHAKRANTAVSAPPAAATARSRFQISPRPARNFAGRFVVPSPVADFQSMDRQDV
jgi:hypothetical protein